MHTCVYTCLTSNLSLIYLTYLIDLIDLIDYLIYLIPIPKSFYLSVFLFTLSTYLAGIFTVQFWVAIFSLFSIFLASCFLSFLVAFEVLRIDLRLQSVLQLVAS